METPPSDRLLQVTRLMLTLLMVLIILAGAALLLTMPILAFRYAEVSRDLAANGVNEASIPWLVAMVLGGVLICALSFFFLRHLRRIVDSVRAGDPFVPINAERLRHMAWLAVAVQAVLLVVAPLVMWFDALPHKQNVHHNSDGISFGALVIALLLFVLARVFRRGAEMREELEGTV